MCIWKDYARLIHTQLVILANAEVGLFKNEKKAEINSTEMKGLVNSVQKRLSSQIDYVAQIKEGT